MPARYVCEKCGKLAWKPRKVKRTGKNPENEYWYWEFKHPRDRRTKARNIYHYVRVDELREPRIITEKD
ncbi:MAG: hypothetical protein JRN68_07085 [Nitrososphaerota archaeon]|jgi:hypothetical protein|nr:hypothetical protein [Nitrososphaerota archaeon]